MYALNLKQISIGGNHPKFELINLRYLKPRPSFKMFMILGHLEAHEIKFCPLLSGFYVSRDVRSSTGVRHIYLLN